MKDLIQLVIIPIILTVYLGASVLAIGEGVIQSKSSTCKNYPTTRLYYIVPAFKLGCWLGEDI